MKICKPTHFFFLTFDPDFRLYSIHVLRNLLLINCLIFFVCGRVNPTWSMCNKRAAPLLILRASCCRSGLGRSGCTDSFRFGRLPNYITCLLRRMTPPQATPTLFFFTPHKRFIERLQCRIIDAVKNKEHRQKLDRLCSNNKLRAKRSYLVPETLWVGSHRKLPIPHCTDAGTVWK